jgi:hypothetical protein
MDRINLRLCFFVSRQYDKCVWKLMPINERLWVWTRVSTLSIEKILCTKFKSCSISSHYEYEILQLNTRFLTLILFTMLITRYKLINSCNILDANMVLLMQNSGILKWVRKAMVWCKWCVFTRAISLISFLVYKWSFSFMRW